MSKKENNNWIFWVGGGIVAWCLFKDKLFPGATINPLATNMQASIDPANALQQLTNTVVKAINPPSTAVPVSGNPSIVTNQQQLATINPVQKSVDNTIKPIPVATQPGNVSTIHVQTITPVAKPIPTMLPPTTPQSVTGAEYAARIGEY